MPGKYATTGDRVRVNSYDFKDATGRLVEPDEATSDWLVHFDNPDHADAWFTSDEFEVIL